MPPHVRRAAGRLFVPCLLLALAGCAPFSKQAPPPLPEPEPEVATTDDSANTPVEPAPQPTKPRVSPKPVHRDVVVVFKSGTSGYANVAAQVAEQLPKERYTVELAELGAASTGLLDKFRDRPQVVAVAVGREAADYVRANLPGAPIVFCQVFNYQDLRAAGGRIWGVDPLPPVTLQLRGWTAVDPSRHRIGIIVSQAQVELAEEAAAAGGGAVEFSSEVSSSDQETLYLFKRLAPQIDGLWLFPDNRILSPGVLRELLSYAVAHDVGVLVFNDALLSWGALMSASSTAPDVARSVRRVLDRVAAGSTRDLPPMTPLAEIELQVNAGVARELGVAGAPQSGLVLREPD
jgi:ABC-type uncharacterized transport system substrate-binding protein